MAPRNSLFTSYDAYKAPNPVPSLNFEEEGCLLEFYNVQLFLKNRSGAYRDSCIALTQSPRYPYASKAGIRETY